MALFVSILGTGLAASESRSARAQTKQAQARQEKRTEVQRAEEEKTAFQASSRRLARRRRRAETGRGRKTILTGSELGSAGGGGKTLLGE